VVDDKEGAGSRNRDALPLDIVEWPVPPYAGTAIRRLFVAVLCPQIPYAPCLTSANSDIYLLDARELLLFDHIEHMHPLNLGAPFAAVSC
jgi:hypothetical protein